MGIQQQFEMYEGRRKDAYLDSLLIWTIGIGFNLERDGANDSLRAQGINPDMIWAAIEETKKAGGGRKAGEHTVPLLSDAQVDALFAADLKEVTDDLQKLFPKWGSMPPGIKDVLCDMRFQLGPSRLRGFKNTLKAFQDGRWRDAAAGMRASLAYKQTTKRWERNAHIVETA